MSHTWSPMPGILGYKSLIRLTLSTHQDANLKSLSYGEYLDVIFPEQEL